MPGNLFPGAGGGQGFVLGPPQNTFEGADRAAAEAARDAYFTANPANLAIYDGDSSLNILLLFTENSNSVALYQIRLSSSWRDNTSAIGVPGMDGMGSLDPNIPDGTILRKATVGGNPVAVASSLSESDETVDSDKTVTVPPSSVDVGGVRVSEAGNAISLTNLSTDITYLAQGIEYDDSGSMSQDNIPVLGPLVDLPAQMVNSDTFTGNVLAFTVSSPPTAETPNGALIKDIVLQFSVATDDFTISIYSGSDASGPLIISQTVDVVSGSNTITYENNPRFLPNTDYHIVYTSPNQFQVLGDNSGTQFLPFNTSRGWPYSETTATNIDNVVGQIEGKSGDDRLDVSQTRNIYSGLTAGSNVTINVNADGTEATISSSGGGGGGPIVASDVTVSDTNLTGIIAGSGNAQAAFDRIDATGLGAQFRQIQGSFAAIYFEGSENTNTWYGGRQTVSIRVNPSANGRYTFTMPDAGDVTSLFDDIASRGLGEVYTLTLEYTGGNTGAIGRNRLTVLNASVSNGFAQGTFPTVLAQGQSATFRIARVGGTVGPWERLSIEQSVNPAPTFGEFVFQNTGWNNSDGSFLPPSDSVLKGYAFPVVGSNPNDGTLRQGLLDSGVSDRIIYDGDYVVWTADSFTSWTSGDDWFVLPRNQLETLTREQANFLAQVTEVDNRVDLGFAQMMTADALVWLSENPLAAAPFLTPSTDPSNPRSGDNYPYIGGRDNRNQMQLFQFGANRFNNYLTIGITPSFITAHPASTIDVVTYDSDLNIIDRLNLEDDFTFRTDGDFTNSTVRHYTRNTTFNYPFLSIVAVVLTQVQDHYTLSPNTVNVTPNVENLTEQQLAPDVVQKLNSTPAAVGIQQPIPPELLKTVSIQNRTPAGDARFLSASPTDTYPSQLSDFNQVSVDNPRWQATDVVLFIAVPEPDNYVLMNTTADTVVALDDSEPTVEVIESFSDSGVTYFVYRVTSIVSGNRYEVERTTLEQKLAIINRIDVLRDQVNELEAEQHEIPNDVRNILENSVTVSEEVSPNQVPSSFNVGLGSGTGQKVYFEATPNAPGAGFLNSNPWSITGSGSRARQKLLYIGENHEYGNADLVLANDGASDTERLVFFRDNQLFARVFVPAIPASTTTNTVYPSQSSRVSGPGIWQTIPALTFVNGVPVPEADEVFFTRDLPTSDTTLTIQYRGHANGNIFGAGTTTLNGVGGPTEVISNITLNDGSETVNLEIRYYPNFNGQGKAIRASITERVSQGLPTVNDVQVILSYTETRTVPATNTARRDVLLEDGVQTGRSTVLAFKPSSTGNLIIVSSDREIDTNFAYTTIFGAGEVGFLTVFAEDAEYFDYQDITPISSTVQALENHASEPNYGLFDTVYTHETIVNLLTQLTVRDSSNTTRNVGDVLTDLLNRVSALEP